MHRPIYAIALGMLLHGGGAFANECPVTQQRANRLRDDAKNYHSPRPATSSAVSGQSGSQGTANTNANSGIAAANRCIQEAGAIKNEIETELRQAKDNPSCSSQEKALTNGKESIQGKLSTCESTLGQLQDQAGKTGDNKDKLGGDDKKKDGKGEGGGGSPPQMPQIPPKKEEKKEDLLAKEKARQAKIKECRARVENALEIKKRNCEYKFPFNPATPVAGQKDKQEDCKQTEIFAAQSDLAQCEIDQSHSPGTTMTYSSSQASATATNSSTVTATPVSTATHTSTVTSP
jgi:hypothetical protein